MARNPNPTFYNSLVNARNNAIRVAASKIYETLVNNLASADSLDAANDTTTPTIDAADQSAAQDMDNSEDPTTLTGLACSEETAATVDNTGLTQGTATLQLNSPKLHNPSIQLTSANGRNDEPKTTPLPKCPRRDPIDIGQRRYLPVPPDALPMPNFENPPPRNNEHHYLQIPPHALPMPNFPPRRKE